MSRDAVFEEYFSAKYYFKYLLIYATQYHWKILKFGEMSVQGPS